MEEKVFENVTYYMRLVTNGPIQVVPSDSKLIAFKYIYINTRPSSVMAIKKGNTTLKLKKGIILKKGDKVSVTLGEGKTGQIELFMGLIKK
ncbi:MAG: hypothetical protein KAX49_13800 [Halanaerobiales bacterium]|nr:hypothetical protein [Halanaerobiales bacterium]